MSDEVTTGEAGDRPEDEGPLERDDALWGEDLDRVVREGEERAERDRLVGVRNQMPVALKAKIVTCLATGMTMRAASEYLDIPRSTIRDLLHNDRKFRELLDAAEQAAVDAIIGDVVLIVKAGIKDLGELALRKVRIALEHDDPRVYMPAARLVLTGGGMVERSGRGNTQPATGGVEDDIGADSAEAITGD